MSILERIIFLIYFPQFKSPTTSRFEGLFLSTSKKENPYYNTSGIIYPEKIIRNEDKRTSIIIKGFPRDMSKKEVKGFLEKFGNLNYLYIAYDFSSENNSSIAYINFINYKSIISTYMNLRNYELIKNGQAYTFEVMYSNVQGKEKLKKYIKKIYLCKKCTK